MNPFAQEPDRVPLRALLVVIAITVGVFGLAIFGAARAARVSHSSVPAPHDTIERSLIVETTTGARDAARKKELDRYRWIDRDAGVAEIPIARAIDLTLEEKR